MCDFNFSNNNRLDSMIFAKVILLFKYYKQTKHITCYNIEHILYLEWAIIKIIFYKINKKCLQTMQESTVYQYFIMAFEKYDE